ATFYGEKVSYRTAWFMFHRIRFAMTQHPMIDKLRGVVEVDETWIGGKEKGNPGRPTPERSKKRPVVALVERERGHVRSFPVERVTVVKEHVEIGTTLQTDENVGISTSRWTVSNRRAPSGVCQYSNGALNFNC